MLIRTGDGPDCGFDALSLKLERRADGSWAAHTTSFLEPLGRPIDVQVAGGKIYVLKYTRPTSFKDQAGWPSGRIIEVVPTAER